MIVVVRASAAIVMPVRPHGSHAVSIAAMPRVADKRVLKDGIPNALTIFLLDRGRANMRLPVSEYNVLPGSKHSTRGLFGERIGAQLELHDLARRPFASLHMERSARAYGSPQSAALPAGIWIIDPAVQPLGIEA